MSEKTECAPWCTDAQDHRRNWLRGDQNCWGEDRPVILGLEEGAPATHLSPEEALHQGDPPRITACAYREWYGLPVVYLHLYRPSENKYLDLDHSFKLTPFEALELANHLIATVEQIGGTA